MAAINDLINQIQDPALRERIQKEVNKLAKQKKFGLVFEEHMPECTPLYDMPIKAGSTVAKKAGPVNDVYTVLRITDGVAACLHKESQETCTVDVTELVAVAEFGESIYPYLKPIDSVCNAPDSDLWHTLIEADNYHALQLLEYLYAGKVDCIYIDPPYNTGAQDWKYNNDYVDDNDTYRHSKWLSFMQKRLLLAKKLLNPKESMLIVTIDEKEYLHLGCLLEEIFPEASMQMISSVIKNGTSMRQYEFSRCNEYIFYLRFGTAVIGKEIPENISTSIPWRPLMRSGTGSNNFRPNRPNSFYPIFVDSETGRLHHIGSPLLPATTPRSSVSIPNGLTAIWPLDTEGRERVWGASPETVKEYFSKGYAKITHKSSKFGVQYITTGVINDIDAGKLIVTGRDSDGGIAGNYSEGKAQMPQNQWNIASHNATTYGTNLLKEIIGNRFTFPKSLYAVHDCLRHAIRDKKDALVVDFFAGSGTTLHAVNLLNAEDGGCRRCILVTNNEVSVEEAQNLTKRNIKPGDAEWNALGIAQYVTWPRTVCSIKGCDINGKSLKGNYIGSEAPMANGFNSNAAFFRLSFLDRTAVALGMTFKEMLPTLWMKAGAVGRCPTIEGTTIPTMLTKFINEQGYLTYMVRAVKINSYLKSLMSLAGLLTQFNICITATDDVKNDVAELIRQYVTKLHASGKYEALAKQVMEMKLSMQIFDVFGEAIRADNFTDLFTTAETDIDRQLRAADAKMGSCGFHLAYGRKYFDLDNLNAFKIDCILFAFDSECIVQLNEYAEKKFHELNDKYRKYIAVKPEKCRKQYSDIVADGDEISKHNFTLPETISARVEVNGTEFYDHLFANPVGSARIKLNGWELAVLAEEQKRADYVCWLRNPPSQSWSLCVPYEMDGKFRKLYPDFIVIRKDPVVGYIVDILEPHNPDFKDNLGKAKGLAAYAANEPRMDRIQLIRVGKDAAGNNRFRRLNLAKGSVRNKVLAAINTDELDHIFDTDGEFED